MKQMVVFQYISCPLCGRNRIIYTANKGRIRWDFVTDLGAFEFVQLREGGGKVAGIAKGHRGAAPGIGFHLVGAKMLTEAMIDPEYADVIQGMRDQLLRLTRDAIRLGLINKDDI